MSDKCIDRILKEFEAETIRPDADTIAKVVNSVEERARSRQAAKKNLPWNDALREASLEAISTEARGVYNNLRIKAISNRIFKERLEALSVSDGKYDEALENMLIGGLYRKGESQRTVGLRQKTSMAEILNSAAEEFAAKDLLISFNSGRLDKQITEELHSLGLEPSGAKQTTNSKDAFEIAQIIRKHLDITRDKQNRLGADIGKLDTFTMRQSWDYRAVKNAGLDAWKQALEKHLDMDKSLKDGLSFDEFAEETFKTITAGKRHEDSTPIENIPGWTGISVARAVSKERKIHFKSGSSFHEMNGLFGKFKTTNELFMYSVNVDSNNIGMMEMFGPNPESTFNSLREKLTQKARDSGDSEIARNLSSGKYDRMWDEVSGVTRNPDNVPLANFFSGWRAVTNMAKLGASVITGFSDVSVKAATARKHGVGFFKGLSEAIVDPIRLLPKSKRLEASTMLGVGADAFLGNIMLKFDPSHTDFPGVFSGLQSTFFKLNGLQFWTEAHSLGASMMYASNLAYNKGKRFGDLEESLQEILKGYDIGSQKWDLLRSSEMQLDPKGRELMTHNVVGSIPDDKIASSFPEYIGREKVLTQKIKDFRADLEGSVRSFLIDQADTAVSIPGSRERYQLLQGTRPGTVMGEAARSFAHFKSFPLTIYNKTLKRDMFLTGKADKVGIAMFIAASTGIGYVSMALKDVIKGRHPRNPASSKTWLAAATQGGGLGIYGDFLLGEYNRFGGGFLETLLGPEAGTASDLASLWSDMVQGKTDRVPAKAFRFTKNNMPFLNLHLLRPILDYAVLYEMQEAISPGSIKRMEKMIEKENSQEWLIKPSSTLR